MNCGPVCVQWLERQYGNDLPLPKARELCGTTKAGSYIKDMCGALTELGYPRVRVREDLTWTQLRSLIRRNHVIVAWWTPLENGEIVDDPERWGGHWSVVQRVTSKAITLYDPDRDGETVMEWPAFDVLWRDVEVFASGRKVTFHHAAVVAGKK